MLPTEGRDLGTVGIDRLAPHPAVSMLLDRLGSVGAVVEAQADALAEAVAAATPRLSDGGRLVYVGSGTSGLIAQGDAAELPATFGWPAERLVVLRPVESEASASEGGDAARSADLGTADVVVALSASGSTAFTLAALTQAVERRSLTIAVVSNPGSPMAAGCDHAIELLTGPEPIAGSTRMRAGLAHRMALTAFSTAVMVGLGRTHSNLMVEVSSRLPKLQGRMVTIMAEATGLDPHQARALLDEADGELKVALVSHLGAVTVEVARARLDAGCSVRQAIAPSEPPR